MNTENGFTLIEVVIALVILSVVMLGLAATTGTLLIQAAEDSQRATAVELIHDRLETMLLDPDYDDLAAEYAGAETNIPGHPNLKRITNVTAMNSGGGGGGGGGGGNIDAKKVTVKMVGPGLGGQIQRSIVVGAR